MSAERRLALAAVVAAAARARAPASGIGPRHRRRLPAAGPAVALPGRRGRGGRRLVRRHRRRHAAARAARTTRTVVGPAGPRRRPATAAARPRPGVVVRGDRRRVRRRRHLAAPGGAAVDRDLGRAADRRGGRRQPVAVAQPVPHDLRRAGVDRAPPRGGAPRRRPPLPAVAGALAGRRAARRRRLVRAHPAGQRRGDHRRGAPGRLHRAHPGRHGAVRAGRLAAHTASCSRCSSAGSGASVRSPGARSAASSAPGARRHATPDRCIDCPECATAAEDGERRAELRTWFVGLTEPAPPGWSDAAFIVLVLAGVTYDGMSETAFGGDAARGGADADPRRARPDLARVPPGRNGHAGARRRRLPPRLRRHPGAHARARARPRRCDRRPTPRRCCRSPRATSSPTT